MQTAGTVADILTAAADTTEVGHAVGLADMEADMDMVADKI